VRRSFSSTGAKPSAGANFALHFAILGNYPENFLGGDPYGTPDTFSFFQSAPEEPNPSRILSTVLTTSLLAGVAGAELWAAGAEKRHSLSASLRPQRPNASLSYRRTWGGWHPRYPVRRTGKAVRIIRTAPRWRYQLPRQTAGTTTTATVKSAWGKALRDGYPPEGPSS